MPPCHLIKVILNWRKLSKKTSKKASIKVKAFKVPSKLMTIGYPLIYNKPQRA